MVFDFRYKNVEGKWKSSGQCKGSTRDAAFESMEQKKGSMPEGRYMSRPRDGHSKDWDLFSWPRAGRPNTVGPRSVKSTQRLRYATLRDAKAEKRDVAATRRDRAAEMRERETDGWDHSAAPTPAAVDRARADEDRMAAAGDRVSSAEDRNAAESELEFAHVDELTGAFHRGIGEEALVNELIRAKRAQASLTLVFVDVDGLKAVNDREGHAVGDALLSEVASSIRSHLRPYDPFVRIGGDEFICTMYDVGIEDAKARFQEIQSGLGGGSISVGLTVMEPNDSLHDLMQRSDEDLRLGGTKLGKKRRH
jgi:diguanylate cyclase (GGDEF)-like protein